MFFVYILQSEKDGRFYIGSTQDLEERLSRHNEGRSGFTKNKGPWKLIHKEIFNNISEARKRENFIKRQKSKKFIKELINRGVEK